MPRMDSKNATGEPDPRLIQTGYGQYSEGHRMSTRLRVFAWIVVAVAMAIWSLPELVRMAEAMGVRRTTV